MSYLEREDDHEDALLLVREDVLDERPPGPDQHDREEQQGALKRSIKSIMNIIRKLVKIHWKLTLRRCVM